ncbi:hypothetical protein D1872_344770 [compost metagenome]
MITLAITPKIRKVAHDKIIEGIRAASTFAVNNVFMLTGVNRSPSSVLRSFSPAKLFAVRMLDAITGMMRNSGANI